MVKRPDLNVIHFVAPVVSRFSSCPVNANHRLGRLFNIGPLWFSFTSINAHEKGFFKSYFIFEKRSLAKLPGFATGKNAWVWSI